MRSIAFAVGFFATTLAAQETPKDYRRGPWPAPNSHPTEWVTGSDYPKEALKLGVSGAIGYRLQIDQLGKPRQCWILVSSGSDLLDQKACALLLKRARFTPATDGLANATTGTYTARVVWTIPN